MHDCEKAVAEFLTQCTTLRGRFGIFRVIFRVKVVHHAQNPAAARGKSCTTRKTLRRPELVRFQDAFWAYVQLRGCGVSVGNVFGQLCDFPLRDALGERDANVILSGAMGREVCDVQLLFLASLNQANTHDSGFCYSR